MNERAKRFTLVFIVLSGAFIAYLHHSTGSDIHALHNIYTDLHYIPLLAGAVVFGLKGAFATFVLILIVYVTYFLGNWTGAFLYLVENSVHIFFPGLSACLVGLLVDRERKQQSNLERDRYLAGLGQAVATIVHDLRSPVINILANTKRAKEVGADPESATERINASAQKMNRLIQDILDFAKPSRLALKETDIREVVQHACDEVQALAEIAGVNLRTNLPSFPTAALVDSLYLERALVNHLSNAIEASKMGQDVAVKVTTKRKSIVIFINDDGKGMDPETLKYVFIPFYTKKDRGTGLGMATAKKIVEEHSGSIAIQSRQGRGTQITIELPLAKPETGWAQNNVGGESGAT